MTTRRIKEEHPLTVDPFMRRHTLNGSHSDDGMLGLMHSGSMQFGRLYISPLLPKTVAAMLIDHLRGRIEKVHCAFSQLPESSPRLCGRSHHLLVANH